MTNRALLAQAFPDSPRLRAQLEAAFQAVDDLQTQAANAQAQLDALVASIATDTFQPESDILTEIAALSGSGAVELSSSGATIRPIDSTDLASLVSRGALGPYFKSLGNYANDAAAATGGVAVGQPYRNGSVVQVRIS